MELLAVFVLGAALLFGEGKPKHAWGYLIVAAILFVFFLAGVQ